MTLNSALMLFVCLLLGQLLVFTGALLNGQPSGSATLKELKELSQSNKKDNKIIKKEVKQISREIIKLEASHEHSIADVLKAIETANTKNRTCEASDNLRTYIDDKLNDLAANLTAAIVKSMHQESMRPVPTPESGTKSSAEGKPKDCNDVLAGGNTAPGVYLIQLPNLRSIPVYCDKGWTVIQRRKTGDLSFDRLWGDFVAGFGDVKDDFWLGLSVMHVLTKSQRYKLRVEFLLDDQYKSGKDGDGQLKFFEVQLFSVGTGPLYTLTANGTYTNLVEGKRFSLRFEQYNSGWPFSTKDRDQDSYSYNCAEKFKAGWWYNSRCHYVNFNMFHSGCKSSSKVCAFVGYLTKSIEMKIRR